MNNAEVRYLPSAGGKYGSIPELIAAGLLETRFDGQVSGYSFLEIVEALLNTPARLAGRKARVLVSDVHALASYSFLRSEIQTPSWSSFLSSGFPGTNAPAKCGERFGLTLRFAQIEKFR